MGRRPSTNHGPSAPQQEREALLAALWELTSVRERIQSRPTTRGAIEAYDEAARIIGGGSTDFGPGGRLTGLQQLERLRLLVRVLARYA